MKLPATPGTACLKLVSMHYDFMTDTLPNLNALFKRNITSYVIYGFYLLDMYFQKKNEVACREYLKSSS